MQPYSETLHLKKQKSEKIRDWGIVLFYALLIYISLPLIPGLWEKLTRYTGNFANYFAAVILSAIGLSIIFYLIFKQKDIRNFMWLLILASAYAWGLSRLKLPIERYIL